MCSSMGTIFVLAIRDVELLFNFVDDGVFCRTEDTKFDIDAIRSSCMICVIGIGETQFGEIIGHEREMKLG